MFFLFVFHEGYKTRKNAKKGAKILLRIMKSWSQGSKYSLQKKNSALQRKLTAMRLFLVAAATLWTEKG